MKNVLGNINFDGITSSVSECIIENTETWNVVFHLPEKRNVLSTRDGFLSVQTIGENISPERLWTYIHSYPQKFRNTVRESIGDIARSYAMLYTGADPRYWACEIREHTLMVFLTVDTRTNAMKTGTDSPLGKRATDPGTINIFLFTTNGLSEPAMARSIITITEAKTAALQDNGIRSSYNNSSAATGTGTDNIIIIPGTGTKINRLKGHSSLSIDIGKAVYAAMNTAISAGRKQENI